MIDFPYQEPDVYRNSDHSQPSTSIDYLEIIRFIWQEHGQAVASSEHMSAKGRGNGRNTIVKHSKRPSCPGRKRGSYLSDEQIKKTTLRFEMADNLGTHLGVRRLVAGTFYHFNDTYVQMRDQGSFKAPGRRNNGHAAADEVSQERRQAVEFGTPPSRFCPPRSRFR